jgi:hypothetical protein
MTERWSGIPDYGSLPSPEAVTSLSVTGDYVDVPGAINLNGIVANNGMLLVVQSSTGKLFRVDPATGIADEVDLGGVRLGEGTADGLELRGHMLYVVRNFDNAHRPG